MMAALNGTGSTAILFPQILVLESSITKIQLSAPKLCPLDDNIILVEALQLQTEAGGGAEKEVLYFQP